MIKREYVDLNRIQLADLRAELQRICGGNYGLETWTDNKLVRIKVPKSKVTEVDEALAYLIKKPVMDVKFVQLLCAMLLELDSLQEERRRLDATKPANAVLGQMYTYSEETLIELLSHVGTLHVENGKNSLNIVTDDYHAVLTARTADVVK